MNIESIDIVMFIRYCSTGQHIVSFCHSAHRLQKYIAMYIGPGFSHSKDIDALPQIWTAQRHCHIHLRLTHTYM